MQRSLRVPILAYHATNVDGSAYATNDHVALAGDLRLIDALGFRVVPLTQVVDALLSHTALPERALAITFDDGTDFDFHDRVHPTQGMQRGMLNILRDFLDEHGAARQPQLHATAFVVASPVAREELDRRSMVGEGWWGDDWWPQAVASGRPDIGNHSWDHNHALVTRTLPRAVANTFETVDTRELADYQIRQAYDYIARKARNAAADLFAYPFGETNEFLLREYLPAGPARTGVRAAFTTEPAHVTQQSNRWALPRYVCGSAWTSPDGLRALLAQA
jgi:peptidoglycan/xylan/chitin deacetylase (PgdA/CDA1 family)